MGLEKILELINEYGDLKWEEGYATGERNDNSSIAACNKAERVFATLLKELEMVIWD
jgi:hypothetical protein